MIKEDLCINDTVKVRLKFPSGKRKVFYWKNMPSRLLLDLAIKRYESPLYTGCLHRMGKWF